MNRNKVNLVVCATTLLFPVSYCTGQSNTVYYGVNSNALAVVFVDTNLSTSVKSNIVVDLQTCLQEWGKSAELRLWNEDGSAGYLYIGRVCPSYPEDLKFPRNIVSNGVSGVALQVPKELSDAYTNAFAFAAAHSNEVKAAYAFVRFVSSTNFANIAPADFPNYLLAKNETPEEIIESAQDNIAGLAKETYYPPSVLGFARFPVGPGEPAVSNLWMCVPCSTIVYDDKKSWSGLPAIWHEGRWKFSLWMLE